MRSVKKERLSRESISSSRSLNPLKLNWADHFDLQRLALVRKLIEIDRYPYGLNGQSIVCISESIDIPICNVSSSYRVTEGDIYFVVEKVPIYFEKPGDLDLGHLVRIARASPTGIEIGCSFKTTHQATSWSVFNQERQLVEQLLLLGWMNPQTSKRLSFTKMIPLAVY